MAIDSVKLINLAAHGIRQAQIASAMGLSPARLTQILSDTRVIDLVEQKKQELAIAEIERIATLDTIAETLLDNIQTLAGGTDNLGEAVRAFETIDKMKQARTATHSTSEGDAVGQVIVQVPIFVQQNLQIQVSSRNEIIEVDERSMAAMPTAQVHRLIKDTHATTTTPTPDTSATLDTPIEETSTEETTQDEQQATTTRKSSRDKGKDSERTNYDERVDISSRPAITRPSLSPREV